MSKPRVLLLGWDAADWKVIQPLLAAGQMPNLARLMAGGVHGNLATIYPVLSPMLWTSIATGKRAYKHGIHGFMEPLPDASAVRPVTLLSRKTKALWNILNQTGHRSIVVGWWPSHPAEPLDGVMVSNYFEQAAGEPGAPAPLPAGTVHPAALAGPLAELRVHPMELSGEFLRLFVPDYQQVDQDSDKRLHSLGKILAETMTVHAVATELLATQPWDFAAIYYSGIDHFGHGFMRYHPPRLPWVDEKGFALYQHVVANGYRYHDAMLGRLLEFTDEHTSVVLLSDHGFHPDHLRPGYIPAEPAGPAVEHRHYGILCLKGPGLRANERVFGASLLDICPTVLALFGLPAGRDMDGKVLLTAFQQPPQLEPIESWDQAPGNAGTHPPEACLDPVASAQAFQQLVELGYVAPPGADTRETVEECVRELKYNLARACRDGNRCAEAATLAQELWARWPKEHRFGILLVDCLGPLHELARRRMAIEELGRRIERSQREAKEELARRSEQKSGEPKPAQAAPDAAERRRRYEEQQLRELAAGRPLLVEWLLTTQAILEKRPAEARRLLKELTEAEALNQEMGQRIASVQAQLGDLEPARALLESALQADPENAPAHAQLAAIHFEAGRFDETVTAATESLSLLYFQPGLHALLGRALLELGRVAEAEQALRVAVAQSPRHLVAHELLARLYREHLHRPAEAFAHEGRAMSLRNELKAQKRAAATRGAPAGTAAGVRPSSGAATAIPERSNALVDSGLAAPEDGRTPAAVPAGAASCASKAAPGGKGAAAPALPELPAPFPAQVDARQVITVVSGLPRSGTSMMMQLLAAAGREPLTDGKRAADEDNRLGYFEFEKAPELAKDASWMPQARGKVVKVVAQLLPYLPPGEHYQVLFMERSLAEVIASQSAMLARQGRPGAALEASELMKTYRAQLQRVRSQLARRAEIRVLPVDYGGLLADPVTGVKRVAGFLGEPFSQEAAVRAVRPELRRQNAERGPEPGPCS